MVDIPARNYTKMRVLLCLQQLAPDRVITIGTIASRTGVNYDSLKVLIRRWVKWDYVKQSSQAFASQDKRIKWAYGLGSKGRAYLKAAPKWYPYIELLRTQARRSLNPSICFFDGFVYYVIRSPFDSTTDYWTSIKKPENSDQVRNINDLFKVPAQFPIRYKNVRPGQAFIDYVKKEVAVS